MEIFGLTLDHFKWKLKVPDSMEMNLPTGCADKKTPVDNVYHSTSS